VSEAETGQDARGSSGLRVVASLASKLNLADYQNAVPVLRELAVVNDGELVRQHLTLTASCDPVFFQSKQWNIDAIGPGQTSRISTLELQLNAPLLAHLTESEWARVKFELILAGSPGAPLDTYEQDLELLPRNHWGGLSHLPEMVAAFIQPNDPAIDRLLKKSAQLLRDNNRNPALNGYEGGSKHAWEILAAIWVAVAAARLDYSFPPASFEQTGQKVRSPGQIFDAGLATCLDLALMFAAAAEQAGLNPLIIFAAGHAYTGCWLRQEEFATTVVDDPSALRKRLQLKELVLFETTLVTQPSVPPFGRACELGARQLSESAESPFEAAIDIRRARMHKIRPLASKDSGALAPATGPPGSVAIPVQIEDPPDLPDDLTPQSPERDPDSLTPTDRVVRWQRKLLDLSLRNSLLNFRKNKRAVVLESPDPGKLEDALASGKALTLHPRPELMEGSDPRDRALYEGRAHEDLRCTIALDGLKKNEVFATAGDRELESTLVDLYRSARSSLEEGGANTLFLALGFLVWTQENKGTQSHRAPLILIPVTLNRRSVRSGFTLTLHDDEPQFNPTLLEMLQQDFQLQINIPEGDLPKDDSGLDVKDIWNRVSTAIKDIKGWEVVPDVVLSTFSFAKHLMWKDLVHRTDQLRQNPVVRHLIDTPREQYQSEIRFVDPSDLDRKCHPREIFCPLPADSSQLAAILSASNGKDFILIGPPGTGKSQTISNLIAHCVTSGKRVLFVAEKIAALEVVYRRLQNEGLGQFCLELHSSKARKSDVVQALGAAWNDSVKASAEHWEKEAVLLARLRDHLNLYVESLHRVRANGMTVHRAFGLVVSGQSVPRIDFPWNDPSAHDVARLNEFRATIEKLAIHATAFGIAELTKSPLVPVARTEWDPLWQAAFLRSVQESEATARQVRTAYDTVARLICLPTSLSLAQVERKALLELASALPACVGTNWSFTARAEAAQLVEELRSAVACAREHRAVSANVRQPWSTNVIAGCRRGIALLEERAKLRADLPAPWPAPLLAELRRGIDLLERIAHDEPRLSARYDYSRVSAAPLYSAWQEAERSIWPLSLLRRRRVAASLRSAVVGGGEPKPPSDLPVLVRLEQIRGEVAAIDLRALPAGLWSGIQTSVAAANAVIQLQAGLLAIRRGLSWEAGDLSMIESGLCGPELQRTLASLSRLAVIDQEVSSLEWLAPLASGLWAGNDTDCENLAAALDFCDDWEAGGMCRSHPAVLRGDCGDELRTQLGLIQRRGRLAQRIESYSHLRHETEGLWRGEDTDLEECDRAIAFGVLLDRALSIFGPDAAAQARLGLGRLCKSTGISEQNRQSPSEFIASCSRYNASLEAMAELGSFSQEFASQLADGGVDETLDTCERISSSAPRLQRWCSWVHIREKARIDGLLNFVTAIESGAIAPDEIRSAFETNYSRWWLDHVVTGDDVLRTFASAEQEKRIDDFRALDDRYTALTRDLIRAKLYASIPALGSGAINPEWGLLQRELTKKKRHLPLRELMARIPTVVTTLTPCLLMSPLSIAQYLSVSSASFDVVVFDEASQITVWDAIGAIARGRQVVMVGDPKQLPPTNFFNRADEEPEDSDDVPEDMESILDECLGASLPAIRLSWHYRSRHESLIAFSNRRYYDGKLVTFPSPITDDRAVSFHYVHGVYEKGGARTNRNEAVSVVKDIIANLKSNSSVGKEYSFGVVTFNSEQQKLIEDLLDAERRADPSIETYFGRDRLEPVFVKNLESVQGDERDIIYFSITYGPDIAGRVSMNFGPMNREGGERRLNVAITRARCGLRVFSSLRPDQLDLSRTQAKGVSELKHFLEFAERGPRAFVEHVTGSKGDFESPFEQYVASALESRGWSVHTQVGSSDFRIDLAVVHPDASGIYLAGVECDGATYHRSATARDRDKLREQVLRGLGWEILRVWSNDWWIDRETTLERLDSRLRVLLEQSRARRAATPLQEPSDPVHPHPEEVPQPEGDRLGSAPTAGEYPTNPSLVAGLMPDFPDTDSGRFFEPSYDSQLTRMILTIVENEGPVLDEVLARRIARLHGWQRTGNKITIRVTGLAAKVCRRKNEPSVGTFYWPRKLEPGQLIPFRKGLDRTVDEVCMPELVSLALDVLVTGKSGTDVVSAMGKALGLQRLRSSSRRRLESAVRSAQRILTSGSEAGADRDSLLD